jgi:septal ring factor EnvC (AmiA/AmiB activator)
MRVFQESRKPTLSLARWLVVALLLACLGAAAVAAPPRNRRGRSSPAARASAAAKQQREKMIDSIRREIDAAKKVLEQAESKQGLSQAELKTATAALAAARREVDDAQQADADLHRHLREIEARILDEQEPDSAYARKEAAMEAARSRLHAEMHRVLGLPTHPEEADVEQGRQEELNKLSDSQRSRLNADKEYVAARDALTAAQRALDELERRLFERDAEWKKESSAHEKADAKSKGTARDAQSSATDVRTARDGLESAAQLAERARATIRAGEAQLKELGVRP